MRRNLVCAIAIVSMVLPAAVSLAAETTYKFVRAEKQSVLSFGWVNGAKMFHVAIGSQQTDLDVSKSTSTVLLCYVSVGITQYMVSKNLLPAGFPVSPVQEGADVANATFGTDSKELCSLLLSAFENKKKVSLVSYLGPNFSPKWAGGAIGSIHALKVAAILSE